MLLTKKPPLHSQFEYKGVNFCIDLSFNNILSVFEILGDEDLSKIDKLYISLYYLTGESGFKSYTDDSNMITDESIKSNSKLLNAIFEHYLKSDKADYVETDIAGNPLPQVEEKERNFSFIHDASFIYASFIQAYRINLYEQHDKMSWKEFMALFDGLPNDTKIMRVIEIRTAKIPTGKGTEEQAKELRKAKRFYALPKG